MVAEIKDITEAIEENVPVEDTEAVIAELKESIKKMKEDREAKCAAAKEQLVSMIEITSDKYRTATGTAEALRTLRFVYGKDEIDGGILKMANDLSKEMAVIANSMAAKAKVLAYTQMDEICDGFYEKEFKTNNIDVNKDVYALAREMMCIDLCRNVGGSAEDMVGFVNRCDEEIKQTQTKLDEMEK